MHFTHMHQDRSKEIWQGGHEERSSSWVSREIDNDFASRELTNGPLC